MSDTAYAGYWEKIVPKQFIVQGLRQDILDWLIQRQIAAVAKYGIKDPRVAAFIILDDVVSSVTCAMPSHINTACHRLPIKR